MVATVALLITSAAIIAYEHAHAVATKSPAQVLLDNRLVWTTSGLDSMGTPILGPHSVYLWERNLMRFEEVDPSGRETEPWSCEPSSKEVASSTDRRVCPVQADGRFYVASTVSGWDIISAYDLSLPPLEVNHVVRGSSWKALQRTPLWARSLSYGVSVSGMTYDNGTLYVTGDDGRVNGGITAINAGNGKLLGWMPFPAQFVGPPLVATWPSGRKVILSSVRCADWSGGVWAVDAASGQVLWTANVPFRPIGSPAEAGSVVVVGGLGFGNRPAMAGFHLLGGEQAWRFESLHIEPDGGKVQTKTGSGRVSLRSFVRERPPQPGGVAAAANNGAAGGYACFACGRWIYAVDLLNGRLIWEQAPPTDSRIVTAVSAIVDGAAQKRRRNTFDPDPNELPRAPWVTAPVFHDNQVLIGTPDGLWAVAAADGVPQWHLRQQEVGAVDVPPLIKEGTAYVAGEGWIGGDLHNARLRTAYAIRLDGKPVAEPTLTTTPGPLRHWPLIAASAAVAALVIAWGCRSRTHSPSRRWPDFLPALFVLATAAVMAEWMARHHPSWQAPTTGVTPTAARYAYNGPLPIETFCSLLALAYMAALLGAWRGRQLAVAAMLSLLIFTTIGTLWARGRRAIEQIHVTTRELHSDRVQRCTFSLMSEMGGLKLQRFASDEPIASGIINARSAIPFEWSRAFGSQTYPIVGSILPATEQGIDRQWHGFEVQSRKKLSSVDNSVYATVASITIPDASLLVAAAFFPAAWLVRSGLRWRKRRSSRIGRCPVCDYSLTGNVSGICPECGTPMMATLPPVPHSVP